MYLSVQQLLRKHQRKTVELGDIFLHYNSCGLCSLFELVPHTPSCFHKYSPAQQMTRNPWMKIVPGKCAPLPLIEEHLVKSILPCCFSKWLFYISISWQSHFFFCFFHSLNYNQASLCISLQVREEGWWTITQMLQIAGPPSLVPMTLLWSESSALWAPALRVPTWTPQTQQGKLLVGVPPRGLPLSVTWVWNRWSGRLTLTWPGLFRGQRKVFLLAATTMGACSASTEGEHFLCHYSTWLFTFRIPQNKKDWPQIPNCKESWHIRQDIISFTDPTCKNCILYVRSYKSYRFFYSYFLFSSFFSYSVVTSHFILMSHFPLTQCFYWCECGLISI